MSNQNNAEVVEKPMAYKLILGVRRIESGSFAGLWELVELDANGAVVRVITDANTKAVVVNLAGREIRKVI